jgi:predicted transcriptional regulator
MSAAAASIRTLRLQAGVSQQDVSKAWGMSQGQLSLIENGHVDPTDEQVTAIKKAIVSALKNKCASLSEMAEGISQQLTA